MERLLNDGGGAISKYKMEMQPQKKDMLYLPIFEAIETDERPYIISGEITNILEGFKTCFTQKFKITH